jgi:hypothetical protein
MVALVLPAIGLARGGKDVASAPELPLARQVSGGGKIVGSQSSGSCSGYAEFWRLAVVKGDSVKLAYGTTDGLPVKIEVLDPSINDKNFTESGVVAYSSTYYKDVVLFVAQKSGRYTVVMFTNYPCQPRLAYTLTATIQP